MIHQVIDNLGQSTLTCCCRQQPKHHNHPKVIKPVREITTPIVTKVINLHHPRNTIDTTDHNQHSPAPSGLSRWQTAIGQITAQTRWSGPGQTPRQPQQGSWPHLLSAGYPQSSKLAGPSQTQPATPGIARRLEHVESLK